MEIVVITHKQSASHEAWGQWWNAYHFDLPYKTGREVWQDWADRLLEWEAGFHSQDVEFLGVTIYPKMGVGSNDADSIPSVFSLGNAPTNGGRQVSGTLHYKLALHAPYGSMAPKAGGQMYHGCLDSSDVMEMVKAGVGLKTWPEFERTLVERAETMAPTHFQYLCTNLGGGGSLFAGQLYQVEMFKVPTVSLLHATTRARFRNKEAILNSYPSIWEPVFAAADCMAPIHGEAVNIAVDIVPVPLVERGIGTLSGFQALADTIKRLVGASREGEQEQERSEPRFGPTRDRLTQLAEDLTKWYQTEVEPMLGTVQTYEYAGDEWFSDENALKIYDALGKGISIASPAMYADWVAMKEYKDGRAGSDPLPDVLELSL